ncbi:SNF5-domain-containing protein [Piedraia hortae CBS 480.64]|uniref:SNF5-domain-containing protein n=1 Tax=Piedraia hortae CBS 480.64 TaxID=1314780 RepID=A0A6A7C589_9PEZI|nr:SNF5-domain-containing protein [Piedraia hortae CBS 480.64]
MAGDLNERVNAPQAFVTSFAPRLRAYGNSLLSPVQPQVVAPQVRTTKRGTTAINYAEEFEDDSIDDSDAPRRPTGLRTQPRRDAELAAERARASELGRDAHEPVEVQPIWRDWLGKPKRGLPDAQKYVPAMLPTVLVPIRIDLDIAPYRPEAALPTPVNARDLGIDEQAPAYRVPDVTPPFRLKDSFTWNLHESLITPDQFARNMVEELDFPLQRKQALVVEIATSIRQQLEESAAVMLHPMFQPETAAPTTTGHTPSVQPLTSREESATPISADFVAKSAAISQLNGEASGRSTPLNGTSTPAFAAQISAPDSGYSVLNPPDSHRGILTISINLKNQLYTDKFEWSLLHPPGFPEIFAKQTCADLGLSGEWVPAMSHAIYEATLRLKKDMVDNGGSLVGVVGSGVGAYGELDNDVCDYHADGTPAMSEGAGWRFDDDSLCSTWEPKIEVLSKEEIEKREGDRERQLRRARRETARFTNTYGFQTPGNDYYLAQVNGGAEEERMGRGERSKKKRRYRSLTPVGRETPDMPGFGGTSGQLTDGERQYWTCSHCHIWGQAVWGVRDGPSGPRTLCANCGLLYERDKRLPRWTQGLFQTERSVPTRSSDTAPPAAAVRALTDTATFPPPSSRFNTNNTNNYNSNAEINPSSHLYTGAGLSTNQISSSTLADIKNYAEPGEDLDWTKIQEPRERKRLQNIINGRKYRERRLHAEGQTGSGGNYPGASGAGSFLSSGYGVRGSKSLAASTSASGLASAVASGVPSAVASAAASAAASPMPKPSPPVG